MFKGLKLLKTPGNGRLNNLNDPVPNVLRLTVRHFSAGNEAGHENLGFVGDSTWPNIPNTHCMNKTKALLPGPTCSIANTENFKQCPRLKSNTNCSIRIQFSHTKIKLQYDFRADILGVKDPAELASGVKYPWTADIHMNTSDSTGHLYEF